MENNMDNNTIEIDKLKELIVNLQQQLRTQQMEINSVRTEINSVRTELSPVSQIVLKAQTDAFIKSLAFCR